MTRTDAGSTSRLRMTYVLRCLKQPCVPERETLPFEFEPALVEFHNRAGGNGALAHAVPGPGRCTRGSSRTISPMRADSS